VLIEETAMSMPASSTHRLPESSTPTNSSTPQPAATAIFALVLLIKEVPLRGGPRRREPGSRQPADRALS
jgi:hypothetical protein